MDLFSRRIVGWSMAERMKADLVIQALQQAHVLRQPSIAVYFIVIEVHNTPVEPLPRKRVN